MKKNAFLNLMLLTVCAAISVTVSSCKEDGESDEEKARQEMLELDPYGKASEEGVLFWSVIIQLTSTEEMPDDWRTARFNPSIGIADEVDPYTRVVITSDRATAAERFANLTDAPVDETTTDYEWSNDLVGTMKYHAGDDSNYYIAIVDVDIKQMPTLKKIIYRTMAQNGMNAEFSGTAYYRFGDVVQKGSDLWICVRPPFGPEGQEESQWVTVSQLPNRYLKEVNYHGYYWRLFQNLGKHKEEMENFAELVYAMEHSEQFFNNLSRKPSLKFFHDFNVNNTKLNNRWFFACVDKAWKRLGLYEKLFHSANGIQEENGLNLFYNTWKLSVNIPLDYTFYYAKFSGENWKKASYETTKKSAMSTGIDFLEEYSMKGQGSHTPSKAYVIRCALGSELCEGGNYHFKTALVGCTDVYVFNKYFYPQGFDLNNDPEETTEAMFNAR